MDQATIQAKVNRGYGIAARFLGAPFRQYRPLDPMQPLGNLIGSVMADFDINPAFSYAAPSKYGNPVYYGLFDATGVSVADYLIGAAGTWFVAGQEPNKPPLCVSCNRIMEFRRPGDPVGSSEFYGGDVPENEAVLGTGIPVSELQGTKGERGVANLPGDTRLSWAIILVPPIPGLMLNYDDRAFDDLNRAWTLSSVELTNLGWRVTASMNDT